MTTALDEQADLQGAVDQRNANYAKLTGRPSASAPGAEDTDAEEFRRQHGYPITAKRLPAGTYEVTGVDHGRLEDPTAPDGVRAYRRGDVLSLTEDEASRLLHLGVIDDPELKAAADFTAATGDLRKLLAGLDEQLQRYRDHRREQAAKLARAGEELQRQLDDLKTKVAENRAAADAVHRLADATDDELAAHLGPTFAELRARLIRDVAELTGGAA